MPYCSKCNKGQTKLNLGDLCKKCYEQNDNDMSCRMSSSQLSNVNNFATLFPPEQIAPIGPARSSYDGNLNPSYQGMNFTQCSRPPTPSQRQNSVLIDQFNMSQQQTRIDNGQNIAIDFDMNTSVSTLTAGQMLALIQSQTKTLETKIESIGQESSVNRSRPESEAQSGSS